MASSRGRRWRAGGWRGGPDETSNRIETDRFGKYLYRKTAEADRLVIDAVGDIAAERALPRAQVALAWLMAKPGVTAPIVGATKPAQLSDAIAAVEVALSDAEIARLEAPYIPHAVAGFV